MKPATEFSVRVPGRVNLIGDHTDYTGGLVFPMAIDRWIEIAGRQHERIHLVSDDLPGEVDIPVGGPFDPSSQPTWGRYVAAVAHEMNVKRGISGVVSTSIPIGAGLSSSAALELAAALALGFEGTATDLAKLGQRAEHLATGVPTGIMDQLCIASAVAGHATMIDCHTLDVTQVAIPEGIEFVVRFIEHRTLVGSKYAERVAECQAAEAVIGSLRHANLADLHELGDELVHTRARHVITENQRVRDFAAALDARDFGTAGEVMTDGHRSLREDYETSTPAMDAAVAELLDTPGVLGARMTGGGFGGCVVAMVRSGTTIEGWRVRPVDGALA